MAKHVVFKACSKPTKIKKIGNAISGFAKSAIADN